jgi:hypothetical protein
LINRGNYQRDILVEDTAALLRVVNYIHLNPVQAHLKPGEMSGFPFGSLNRFTSHARSSWLMADAFLAVSVSMTVLTVPSSGRQRARKDKSLA